MQRWAASVVLAGVLVAAVVLALAPGGGAQSDPLLAKSWDEILKEARGQTVRWWMWAGDEGINRFVDEWIAPRVKEQYGVTLKRIPIRDTVEGVQKVVGEKQAGKLTGGSVDMNWIGGENLLTLKQGGLLWKGYERKFPNGKYINWNDPIVTSDHGLSVEGTAIAWGLYQQVLAYDSAKVKTPPRNHKELLEWTKANPGRFTYPAPPDFTGTIFIQQAFHEATGGSQQWVGPFKETLYRDKSPALWKYLNDLKPHLWRKGETYPETVSPLDQLYAGGEVWFTMSAYQLIPARNVVKGIFPKTTRTYVFETGAQRAGTWVGIPFNTASKAGALAVVNFLMSPEAQAQLASAEVWGIDPGIDATLLPADWQEKFRKLSRGGENGIGIEALQRHALPAIHAKYITVMEGDWRKQVLKK